MTWVWHLTSNVMGNKVELSPGQDINATPEQIGAAFDKVFTALAEIGLYPTRIEVSTAPTEETEAAPQNITQARRAERTAIADELASWAERHQRHMNWESAAALAIASNDVRRGGSK